MSVAEHRLRAVLLFSSDHASKSTDKIMQMRKANEEGLERGGKRRTAEVPLFFKFPFLRNGKS